MLALASAVETPIAASVAGGAVFDNAEVRNVAEAAEPGPALVTDYEDALFSDEDVLAGESAALPRAGSLAAMVAQVKALPAIEMDRQMRCLATAIYFESRGEPLEGQLAVAQVILNRVESGRWAKDICGVVYQPGQFSFTWDRTPDTPRPSDSWATAQALAVIAATGQWDDMSNRATHFHATRVSPGWRKLTRVSQHGNHIFYR